MHTGNGNKLSEDRLEKLSDWKVKEIFGYRVIRLKEAIIYIYCKLYCIIHFNIHNYLKPINDASLF